MEIEWDDTCVLPPQETVNGTPGRFDVLLPLTPETGAVTAGAFRVYLDAMIDLVSRESATLSLISISVDTTQAVRFFGPEGAGLIGKAIVRGVRQETRLYDVVGCSPEPEAHGIPIFFVACPLLDETRAAALAERLGAAMTAQSTSGEAAWLTLSVGVASLSIEAGDADSLLSRTMAALHKAKRHGGGRVWRHSDTIRRLIADDEVPLGFEHGPLS